MITVPTIVVVDYGMGNLRSIANMFKEIGVSAVVTSSAAEIERAGKVVLPGVGAFDSAMRRLNDSGLVAVLERKVVNEGAPLLGICLGMQLLGRVSEEGSLPGLGWIDAETVRLCPEEANSPLKVPHMGWNTVKGVRPSPLFPAEDGEERFYFVHSYHVVCRNRDDVAGVTVYGREFVSAVHSGNIMGVQFHPEKSHRFGMRLLRSFAEFSGC